MSRPEPLPARRYRWRRRAERGALHAFHPTDPSPGSGPVRLSACARVWTDAEGIRGEPTMDYFWPYQRCARCEKALGIVREPSS